MGLPYVPSRGCLSCPNRGTCHDSRQRLQDGVVEAGRHYSCTFYKGIAETKREREANGWYGFLKMLVGSWKP